MMSLEPLKSLFQWSDDEGEVSGYASSVTVSSVQTDRVSVNMTANNNNDLRQRMELQEQKGIARSFGQYSTNASSAPNQPE